MPDHLLLLAEDSRSAVHAMEVFPVAKVLAVRGTAFQGRAIPENIMITHVCIVFFQLLI